MIKLSNRRPCVTYDVQSGGERYHISVGINPDTAEVAEIFGYGPKPGSERWAILQDLCIMMSKQLQRGVTPRQLAAQAIREEGGAPVSVVGIMADLLCENFTTPPGPRTA